MGNDVRLEMKNCNMILTEKQQKTQLNCQIKLTNMHILQEKKHCLLIKTELQSKLNLLILFLEELLKKK